MAVTRCQFCGRRPARSLSLVPNDPTMPTKDRVVCDACIDELIAQFSLEALVCPGCAHVAEITAELRDGLANTPEGEIGILKVPASRHPHVATCPYW